MKKFLLLICFLCTFGLSISKAHANYCLVSHNDSNPGNIYSLPYMVAHRYNSQNAEQSLCSNATGTLDRWLGFQQSIRFATSEAGTYKNVLGQTINIRLIRISEASRVITFNNPIVNLEVGNWPLILPEPSAYDYAYPINYDPATRLTHDYGAVTIDGTALPAGISPLRCDAGTKPVILRNLVIKTNRVTRTDFFSRTNTERNCLLDGGAVYVCGGTVNASVAVGAPGWCSDAVSPTTEDHDGDSYCAGTSCRSANLHPGDCNDNNVDINPDASETCDYIDNDCDGQIDDGFTKTTTYRDGDNDGYGTTDIAPSVTHYRLPFGGSTTISIPSFNVLNFCPDSVPASGWAIEGGDCNDSNSAIHPDATDTCGDSIDQDCSGADLSCTPTPGGEEICGDGIDNNADGLIDCTDPACQFDLVACPGDHPPAPGPEICGNGIDDNGDTYTDCDDSTCADDPACPNGGGGGGGGTTTAEICDNSLDDDGDMAADCADTDCATAPNCVDGNVDADDDHFTVNNGDCDDADPTRNPGVTEICDGIDNNCDGNADGICQGDFKTDDDHDGYCEDATACTDATQKPGDCDDTNPSINPGATEFCSDSIDSNCNGMDDDTPPTSPTGSGDGTTVPEVSAPTTGAGDLGGPSCVVGEIPPGPGASGGCGCDLADHQAPIGTLLILTLLGLFQPGFLLLMRLKNSNPS